MYEQVKTGESFSPSASDDYMIQISPYFESREQYFSEPISFEGGFNIPPLLKQGWKIDDFESAWIPKLPPKNGVREQLLLILESIVLSATAPASPKSAYFWCSTSCIHAVVTLISFQ